MQTFQNFIFFLCILSLRGDMKKTEVFRKIYNISKLTWIKIPFSMETHKIFRDRKHKLKKSK